MHNPMNVRSGQLASWPVGLLLCLLAGGAFAQAKDPLFTTVETALAQAKTQQVDALAPNGFAAANEDYQDALKDAERKRNPERIKAKLNEALATLQTATKAATTAREKYASVVKTRDDAVTANAPKLGGEGWARAAERFNEAMIANEKGDAKNAGRRAAEAEVLLRDVELMAIKGGVLNEARGLIAKADEAKVAKTAPRTLAAAKRHLSEADAEIQRNRYDLTVAKQLAAQARYDVLHANYLQQTITAALQQEKDDQAGLEALILSWEEPLGRMGSEMEVSARFDQGPDPALRELAERARQQREELRRLGREVRDRDEQIALLDQQVQKLDARLGGVSAERVSLQRRVDAQETIRTTVAQVETSFTPDEARVYRQGDDVVISLTGIRFASGKSTIDKGNDALMGKVQAALTRFEGATISVEGHTDANGSDSANLILSQDRADAVKQYLVDHAHINPEKISSIGYGEARPVATNETNEGRTRNRRIDLVVHVAPR